MIFNFPLRVQDFIEMTFHNGYKQQIRMYLQPHALQQRGLLDMH